MFLSGSFLAWDAQCVPPRSGSVAFTLGPSFLVRRRPRVKLPEFWPADHQPQGGCGEATGGQVCIRHIRPQDGVGGWTGSAVRTREASAVELVVERVFLRVSRALGTMHSAGAATRSQTVCSPAARQVEGLVKRQLQDGPSLGGDKRGTVEHQGRSMHPGASGQSLWNPSSWPETHYCKLNALDLFLSSTGSLSAVSEPPACALRGSLCSFR